jgi:GAF domain-containing protein
LDQLKVSRRDDLFDRCPNSDVCVRSLLPTANDLVALQQQTATSEVLGVISTSPSDLRPVFQTMLANATRLCDATFGLLLLYEGDWRFRAVAMSNAPPAFAELRQREPVFEVSPQTGLGRVVATKEAVHIADYAEEAIYKDQRHPAAVALGELGGARTFLVVPMLKDNEIIGAIAIYRQQVRPFADKQLELVKNFAASRRRRQRRYRRAGRPSGWRRCRRRDPHRHCRRR